MKLYRHRGAVYREARTVHDLTPEYLRSMQANDWVRVYHGTGISSSEAVRPQDMVFGIDATGKHKSYFHPDYPGGFFYRGLYVGPTRASTQGFGSLVFEFAVKAKNLHATDWSSNILRRWEQLVQEDAPRERSFDYDVAKIEQLCAEHYPDSFNPILSGALDERPESCGRAFRDDEPQALFIGIVPARDILAVHYVDRTYTPTEFIERYQKDLSWQQDQSSPDPRRTLTWPEYQQVIQDYSGYDTAMLADGLFWLYFRDGEESMFHDLQKIAPFSRPSAERLWELLKEHHCERFVELWDQQYQRDPDADIGERPRCGDARTAATPARDQQFRDEARAARAAFERYLDQRSANLRTAAKMVLYHGTSDQYLRDILKHGLKADPPERQYGEEAQHNQTYGGAYLTPNLHTAHGFTAHATDYGRDSNAMMVIVQVETRSESIVPDEDRFLKLTDPFTHDIRDEVARQFDWDQAHAIDVLDRDHQGQIDLADWVEPWIDHINKTVVEWRAKKMGIDKSSLLPRHQNELAEILRAMFRYEVAGARQHQSTKDHWLELAAELSVPETEAQARQEFVEAVDELSRKVQSLTDPQEHLSVRSLRDIGYRGANRIVGILRWRMDDDRQVGEIVYSSDDPLVLETLQQICPGCRGGEVWTDQQGSVVYRRQPRQKAASITTKTEVKTDDRRNPTAQQKSADRDTGASGRTGAGADVVRAQDPDGARAAGPADRRSRDQVDAAGAAPTRAAGGQTMTTLLKQEAELRLLKTAEEPGASDEGPSEYEMTEQLEQDPGAKWRDLYLQPIIRAIRNRFDLPKSTVTLVGPKKKTPFGDDTLGFELTGHVRFEDFKPPVDEFGRAPYRFTCNVSPEGELLLPVQIQGG